VDMKKDIFFQLSQNAAERLAERFGTPLLVLSLEQIEKNYRFLKKHLPRVQLYYAIKANPHQRILELLRDLGSCFDVASDGEIRTLAAMGIDGERLIYANPIKTGGGLQACCDVGVHKMTFDSESEIVKMAQGCPGATVLLRIRIDNSSAHVDLNKKFGVGRERAVELLQAAQAAGLDAAGVCFHVGSQTMSADPYLNALDLAREIFEEAAAAGMQLRILDIGGGFPIPEPKVRFNLKEMLKQINARLDEDFPNVEIWAEPGRFMCGTAVNLITSVIGVTERGGQPWYFLDDGLYGTFSGVIFDQWDFKLISFKEGEEVEATFAGPSCDSLDIMFRGKLTVRQEVGDLLLVPSCGAYTSASATTFNGFSKANFIVWEDLKDEAMEQFITQYKQETDKKYDRIVTRFTKCLTHPLRNQETALGNLIADILKDSLGIDLMLLGSGEVRSYELGPVVHYHSLVECLPYDEAVYMLKVTGAQLEHMLRFILREEAFLGEHTEFYQFSHGMQIIWSRKEQTFRKLNLNDQPIEEHQLYSIALSKYHFMNISDFMDISLEETKKNAKRGSEIPPKDGPSTGGYCLRVEQWMPASGSRNQNDEKRGVVSYRFRQI